MYLVTGCCGFIGSNMVHYLTAMGEEVVGIDVMTTGSDALNLNGTSLRFLEGGDIRNKDHLEFIFTQNPIDRVIHLAAQTHVDRSIESDKIFWDTNVEGTRTLMETCREAGVTMIVNQITDEVYGPKEGDGAKEGDVLLPTSPYPCSKAGQYYVGKSYYHTYGLPVVSTFPVNCYGPRQYPEKLIPKFVTRLLNNQKVPLMSSTHFQRDWLPVEDMCRALYLLSQVGVPGEDYNIGADNHHSNLELTKKLIALCNKDESYIEIIPDRVAHDSRYAVCSDKIKSLGWETNNDFDEYLGETVAWYKARSCGLDNK